MRSRIALVLITLLALAVLPLAAQDKAPAKKPMAMCGQGMGMKADMMAMHDKIMSTWNDVTKATTPAAKDAALKAHGEALAEMEAAHQKMMAGGCPGGCCGGGCAGGCCSGDMSMCKQKMGMGKGKMGPGKGMACPCCAPDDSAK